MYPNYQTWSDWDANQRDLVFLDKNGDFFCKINLTSGFNEEEIINKIQHLDWYTTAYVETDIDILGDNIYLAGATYDLLITETNLSDFDSHYTGYSLSSNSDFIEFSLEENWFYVIFAGDTYTDNSTHMKLIYPSDNFDDRSLIMPKSAGSFISDQFKNIHSTVSLINASALLISG